jgi:hypothetical protein
MPFSAARNADGSVSSLFAQMRFGEAFLSQII